jgi:predicted secreted protein
VGVIDTTKLDTLRARLADKRSNRVVFVSHCILNENVRYLGGAFRPGGVDEVIDSFQHAEVGIYQMPCPEQRAWGGVLKRYLVPMYASQRTPLYRLRRPATRLFLWRTQLIYDRLARRVVHDIADYVRSGVEVVGIIGIRCSPSCGVCWTLDVPRSVEVMARCDLAGLNAADFNETVMAEALHHGRGRFIEAIQRGLARHNLYIPFYEHDLLAEMRGEVVSTVTVNL